jgi:hypothetical protein
VREHAVAGPAFGVAVDESATAFDDARETSELVAAGAPQEGCCHRAGDVFGVGAEAGLDGEPERDVGRVHVDLSAHDAAWPVVLGEVGDQQLAGAVADGNDTEPVTPRELVLVQELVQLLDRNERWLLA